MSRGGVMLFCVSLFVGSLFVVLLLNSSYPYYLHLHLNTKIDSRNWVVLSIV